MEKLRLFLGVWIFFATLPCLAIPYEMVDAARRGDGNAVKKWLAKDATTVDAKDEQGYSALHWAAIRGHWRIFEQLLDRGAKVDVTGADGGSPLHWACHHDRPDMVARLLDKGADLNQANQWGRYPLHVAARRGCVGVVSLLLERGASTAVTTKEGWTPLHVAYKGGHEDVVQVLLKAGADSQTKDKDGKTPQAFAWKRPAAVSMSREALSEFEGLFDLGPGFTFKIWGEPDGLHIREFAPDQLIPVGKDQFMCAQEPWKVQFLRDEGGAISAVNVDFLRRQVQGKKRQHARYVGSQECKSCHMGGKTGGSFMQWITSRHGAAYWRLATDWSKLLATFRPEFADITEPIKEDRCLLCHLTAAQDPDALFADSYRMEEGVGCETCHGPGSLYLDEAIMSDREQFLSHGGIIPDEKTCQKCHRNPQHFDFATWFPKIDHSAPAEEAH